MAHKQILKIWRWGFDLTMLIVPMCLHSMWIQHLLIKLRPWTHWDLWNKGKPESTLVWAKSLNFFRYHWPVLQQSQNSQFYPGSVSTQSSNNAALCYEPKESLNAWFRFFQGSSCWVKLAALPRVLSLILHIYVLRQSFVIWLIVFEMGGLDLTVEN